MSEHARINDLLPLYISGGLDEAARRAVEAHLPHCRVCRADLLLWQAVEEEVTAAPGATPPAVVERALLDIRTAERAGSRWRRPARRAWQILRSQVGLVRRDIWPASAAVMALGYITAVLVGEVRVIGALAPMLAAGSIAAIYGAENDPALELALATPTSPRQILLARMALVFGYNLILALAATLALLPMVPAAMLGGLILGWLAPMAFLSALALTLSLVVGTGSAITVVYVAWLARPLVVSLPETLSPAMAGVRLALAGYTRLWASPALLLALAAILLAIALWRVGRQENSRPYWA
jgi:hypothetical protein